MHALISAIATILVPGVACFLVPYLIIKGSGMSFDRPFGLLQLLAVLLAATGLYMIVWVSVNFVRQGKGTPVPIEPPSRLVVSGLYQRVRNPMYTGAMLVLLAEALYFSSFWILIYMAGLWVVLHSFVVFIEEPQLKHRFGQAYEQYLAEVPRWIPRIKPPVENG